MRAYAPIIVFVYKRKEHTKKCLDALSQNQNAGSHDLYIFADGARTEAEQKDVQDVRNLIRKYEGSSSFHKVVIKESDVNKGLAKSINEGVSAIISQYGRAIVVEDDLITSKDFLTYMNGALDYYDSDERIGSISGSTYPVKGLENYPFDVYAIKKGECWGWGTWKRVWQNVDWSIMDFQHYKKNRKLRRKFNSLEYGLDNMLVNQMEGKIDSWAVRWCYHLFKNDLMTVYPRTSKALNIGLDGSGTHCHQAFGLEKNFAVSNETIFMHVEYDKKLAKEVAKYESRQTWIGRRIMSVLFGVFSRR